MPTPFQQIKTALVFASFDNVDVMTGLQELINELERELDRDGWDYEASESIVDAVDNLSAIFREIYRTKDPEPVDNPQSSIDEEEDDIPRVGNRYDDTDREN